MAKSIEIDEQEISSHTASNRVAAAIDVQRNSDRYMKTYTAKETERAWDAYARITTAYNSNQIYVNFRKDFIAIKVSKPRVKHTLAIETMDQGFAHLGISKVITPLGIIYQIPKKAAK